MPPISGGATASAVRAVAGASPVISMGRRGSRHAFRATAGEEIMSKKGMMRFAVEPATMWTLGKDRKSIRFAAPPLWLAGMPEPIHAFVEFDAKTVDAIVERLTILRSQRVPPLPARSLVRWHDAKARV